MNDKPLLLAEKEIEGGRKLVLEIWPDEDVENPRECESLTTIVCFHSRCTVRDKHDFQSPEELGEWLEDSDNNVCWLPLYAYEHSGLTIRTVPFSCIWDSGQIGAIYIENSKVQELWPELSDVERRKKAEEVMLADVEVYDQWLQGECFGFIARVQALCSFGGWHNIEAEEEACWGFIGDDFKKSGMYGQIPESHRELIKELK